MDLAELFTGALSPRRALLLAERAVHDPRSHLRASMLGGPEHLGWGVGEHLAALVVDAVNVSTVAGAQVAGAKKVRPMPPTWRPGRQSKQPRTLDEAFALLPAMLSN